MKLLEELKQEDLKGKNVLLRVDFNVPVDKSTGKIDGFRITSHLPTIDYLLTAGARVFIISHIAAIDSFRDIFDQISAICGRGIVFSELGQKKAALESTSNLVLFDNLRQDPGEEKNDPAFARHLADGFDIYVNDAFAVSHRKHASLVSITQFLPSCAGLLIKKEISNLGDALNSPKEGKVFVIGGAKISTKLPVIKNFLDKAEKILVGGAIANDFFRSRGINVGISLVDETTVEELDPGVVALPRDIVITNDKTGKSGTVSSTILKSIQPTEIIVDIGPQSAEAFAEIIEQARLVIWNGPMGLSEIKNFAKGTEIVAQAVSKVEQSIIGGGDTISAVDSLGLLDRIGFVSTGGGAMLNFLAGEKLPGLEALGYYN